MKKSAIAVAVAAVLAAPVALADVQVSGVLQTEVVSIGGDLGNKGLYVSDAWGNGVENTGNVGSLNIVASEDLGDGLKALAKYSMNVATSSKAIGTREAYVGVAGGFGAVLGGRLNHPYKTSTIGWDPFLSTSLQARFNGGMTAAGHGSEVDNALAYAGSFGAVKVVAAIVLDEVIVTGEEKTGGKNTVAFSVNAPVGPVEVALGYINASKAGSCSTAITVDTTAGDTATPLDTTTTCAEGGDNKVATKLGVKWASGDFTVAGQVEMLDKGWTGEKGNVMYVTGSYKMGNNTISAAYGNHEKKLFGTDKGVTYMAVGVSHAMSKNTNAYVGYRGTDYMGDKENAVAAGLRVKF